jgi:pyruvate carboxylase subunit B
MIFIDEPKRVRVMFTPFRDGLQSIFGGKVRLKDFLPAMQAAAQLGVRHFEFGGGALFQAAYFYLGENPFENMRAMRTAVGPDADLQILTRSVSGVTLTTQAPEVLALQARLMAAAGTTVDRNFDYMNDVRNLESTGRPIVASGMRHEAVVALMGLPFHSDRVHTPDFYIDIGRRMLASDVRVDSLCLKDASGTTDPATIYHTAVGLKKLMPPEMPLWLHTHDTAATSIACYMAGIHGGVDGVDVSIRPLANGTSQPDARALAHCLKGTGYSLDIDVDGLGAVESLLEELLASYEFDSTTTIADARVLGFPMPGGAIGPNVQMMKKAGIFERYGDVLAEFPVVVEAGGAWTSVTPGSQQYWLQAFNNVRYGRWQRIDAGYGKAVLGYFGRTPLRPDPEIVRIASEQLELPRFDGDPLAAAPDTIPAARDALETSGLPITDENIFLVLAAMVPGKKLEVNEGLRLLTGRSRIDVPLRRPPAAAEPAAVKLPERVTTRCTVQEGDRERTFTVTLERLDGTAGDAAVRTRDTPVEQPDVERGGTPVYTGFAGSVEVVDVLVGVGDRIRKGTVVAAVEAMKARHEIRAPRDGKVTRVHVEPGREIDSSTPIITLS